jgi:hypothetical protein
MGYSSNQFPIKVPPKPKNGRLWNVLPDGRRVLLLDDKPFWKLQQEKKNLRQLGYKNTIITY